MGMKIQKALGPILDRFVPKANLVDAVRPVDMTRNPSGVKAFIDDPLVLKTKVPIHTGWEFTKAWDYMKSKRGEITCPILLLHGDGDKCTSINASRGFFNGVGSTNDRKTFLHLPGLYHELLEEPEIDQLMISLVEFCSSGGKKFARVKGKENEDGTFTVELE